MNCSLCWSLFPPLPLHLLFCFADSADSFPQGSKLIHFFNKHLSDRRSSGCQGQTKHRTNTDPPRHSQPPRGDHQREDPRGWRLCMGCVHFTLPFTCLLPNSIWAYDPHLRWHQSKTFNDYGHYWVYLWLGFSCKAQNHQSLYSSFAEDAGVQKQTQGSPKRLIN